MANNFKLELVGAEAKRDNHQKKIFEFKFKIEGLAYPFEFIMPVSREVFRDEDTIQIAKSYVHDMFVEIVEATKGFKIEADERKSIVAQGPKAVAAAETKAAAKQS